MGICHNCRSEPTIRAHIIPKAFAVLARAGAPYLVGVTYQRESINQSGFFDPNILCATCDGKLGDDDKFAVEFCRAHKTFNPKSSDRRVEFPGCPKRLARFANAVLYRASISRLPEFCDFSVGEQVEEQLRCGLFGSGQPLCDAIIFRYRVTGEIDPFEVFSYPYIHNDKSGIQFATFSLGRFRFSIRVGGEQITPPLHETILNKSNCISAYCVDFENTTEYERMAQLSKLHS